MTIDDDNSLIPNSPQPHKAISAPEDYWHERLLGRAARWQHIDEPQGVNLLNNLKADRPLSRAYAITLTATDIRSFRHQYPRADTTAQLSRLLQEELGIPQNEIRIFHLPTANPREGMADGLRGQDMRIEIGTHAFSQHVLQALADPKISVSAAPKKQSFSPLSLARHPTLFDTRDGIDMLAAADDASNQIRELRIVGQDQNLIWPMAKKLLNEKHWRAEYEQTKKPDDEQSPIAFRCFIPAEEIDVPVKALTYIMGALNMKRRYHTVNNGIEVIVSPEDFEHKLKPAMKALAAEQEAPLKGQHH